MIPPYGRGGRGIGLDSQTGVRLGGGTDHGPAQMLSLHEIGQKRGFNPLEQPLAGGRLGPEHRRNLMVGQKFGHQGVGNNHHLRHQHPGWVLPVYLGITDIPVVFQPHIDFGQRDLDRPGFEPFFPQKGGDFVKCGDGIILAVQQVGLGVAHLLVYLNDAGNNLDILNFKNRLSWINVEIAGRISPCLRLHRSSDRSAGNMGSLSSGM